jgi:hypothetical protein
VGAVSAQFIDVRSLGDFDPRPILDRVGVELLL